MGNNNVRRNPSIIDRIRGFVGLFLFFLPGIALALFGLLIWSDKMIEGPVAIDYVYYRLPVAAILVVYFVIFFFMSFKSIFTNPKIKSKIGFIFLSIFLGLAAFAFLQFAVIDPIKAYPYKDSPITDTLVQWEITNDTANMDGTSYDSYYLNGTLSSGEEIKFEISSSTHRKLKLKRGEKITVMYYPFVNVLYYIEEIDF